MELLSLISAYHTPEEQTKKKGLGREQKGGDGCSILATTYVYGSSDVTIPRILSGKRSLIIPICLTIKRKMSLTWYISCPYLTPHSSVRVFTAQNSLTTESTYRAEIITKLSAFYRKRRQQAVIRRAHNSALPSLRILESNASGKKKFSHLLLGLESKIYL